MNDGEFHIMITVVDTDLWPAGTNDVDNGAVPPVVTAANIDGDPANEDPASTFRQDWSTEVYGREGWHFFHFAYQRDGSFTGNNALGDYSNYRKYEFHVARAEDGFTDPLWQEWEWTNSTMRPAIYGQFIASNALPNPANPYFPAVGTEDVVSIGHRTYPGGIAGKYLKGWFYLLGNYPEWYIAYDDPAMMEFYADGVTNCPNSC